MNMRTSHDPYGAPTTLIDKMIGNAYEVVKYVARHVQDIKYVAHHMDLINAVKEGMKGNTVVLGITGIAGETISAALPEGVTHANILGSSVVIVTTAGDIYSTDSGFFTATIQQGALRLKLNGNAPAALEAASFRWFLTFGVS